MKAPLRLLLHLSVVTTVLLSSAYFYVNQSLYKFSAGHLAIALLAGLAVLAAHFAAFRYARQAWTVACLIVASSAVALWAVEGVLKDRLSPPDLRVGTSDLTSEIAASRKEDPDFFPAIVPTYFLKEPLVVDGVPTVPLGGIASTRAFLCREGWGKVVVRSDAYGFVNPPEVWGTSGNAIAIAGDSFVQGMCVPPETHFVQLVRRAVPRTINIGAGGNGPLLELAGLREYLAPVAPKIVFWFYYEGNDLTGNLDEELANPILSQYRLPAFSQRLRERQGSIDAALREFAERRWRTTEESAAEATAAGRHASWAAWMARDRLRHMIGADTWSTLTLARTRAWLGQSLGWRPLAFGASSSNSAGVEARIGVFREVLEEARREVHAWGGQLVFVYLPSFDSLGLGLTNPYRERVLFTVADLEILSIDMARVFRSELDVKKVFPLPSGHYSPEANTLIAREVLKIAGAAK